jgi:DNA-directed RNA polymerase subunit K/omega
LEKLEPEDVALREIIEGKITYQPWDENSED